jgi:hypothetical protein
VRVTVVCQHAKFKENERTSGKRVRRKARASSRDMAASAASNKTYNTEIPCCTRHTAGWGRTSSPREIQVNAIEEDISCDHASDTTNTHSKNEPDQRTILHVEDTIDQKNDGNTGKRGMKRTQLDDIQFSTNCNVAKADQREAHEPQLTRFLLLI